MRELCDNGRSGEAPYPPCPNFAIHWICVTDGEPAKRPPPIKLCDRCFKLALQAGLIENPYMSKEVFDQNEKERLRASHA